MKRLTIFTPTYNRAYILKKCYDSLVAQTCKDFVWLVVDDGSFDNTKELINKFIKEKKIEIKYIYQKNGGKYKAVNTGVKNCDTELFAFVDSDDYYLPNTVKIFLNKWDEYCKKDIVGIVGRRQNNNGIIVGKKINLKMKIVSFSEFISKEHFYGDTCRMYKTTILKSNLYPEINDRFIPENVMFGKIDETHNILFLNEALSVSEYLDDGYTNSYKKLLLNNPNGYALSLLQSIRNENKICSKIKLYISYICWCKRKKIEINKEKTITYFISYPFALICLLIGIPTWHTPKRGFLNKTILYFRLFRYFFLSFFGVKLKILDDLDTINYSNKFNKSIIRLGDGEFNLINGEDICYQKYSNKLRNELIEIIKNYDYQSSNYLLCIPKQFLLMSGFKLLKKRNWISSWAFSRYYVKRNFENNVTYGDAFIFSKGNERNYSKLWSLKKYKLCIFVHNNEKFANKFQKCYKINTKFIKVTSSNSYNDLDAIKNEIIKLAKNFNKDDIIIIASMGPAAKALVYEICHEYRVIDAGHCFDFPLKKGL